MKMKTPTKRKKNTKRKFDHPRVLQCSAKVLDQILGQKCHKHDLKIKIFKKWKNETRHLPKL